MPDGWNPHPYLMGGIHIRVAYPQRCMWVCSAAVFGKDMERRTLEKEEEDALALLEASTNDMAFPLGGAAPQKGERK